MAKKLNELSRKELLEALFEANEVIALLIELIMDLFDSTVSPEQAQVELRRAIERATEYLKQWYEEAS